ncbi:MAG: hypothetical protein IT340_18565 [Chloroflexi bacterium]|nr:hypothetical protein [Chloroflexota bacterium]
MTLISPIVEPAPAPASEITLLPDTGDGPDTYAERAGRAAAALGLAPPAVRRLPFDLSILAEEGIFLDVTAHGAGLLTVQLGWDLLGVVLPPDAAVGFAPPTCRLLPERHARPLARLLGAGHDLLRRHSFRFALVEAILGTAAYRWVPATAVVRFHRQFLALQAELEAAKAAVVADYDRIVGEAGLALGRLAADSARRLAATGHAVPPDFDRRLPAAFHAALPTRAAIRERIALRLEVGVFQLGSELAAEQRRAITTRRQVEIARIEADGAAQAAQARLFAEQEAQTRDAEAARLMHHLRVEAERRLVERMVEQRLSPLAEAAEQLHRETAAVAEAVGAALRKHGRLPASSYRQLRRLADYLRLMNFEGDDGLARLIAALEERAATTTGRRRRPRTATAAAGEAIERCVSDLVAYTRGLADLHGGRAGAVEL